MNTTRSIRAWLAPAVLAMAQGCAFFAHRPEVHPELYAPSASSEPWRAPEAGAMASDVASFSPSAPELAVSSGPLPLDALVERALNANPALQNAWWLAREQAALYGISYASYYPRITYSSVGGFSRFMYSSIVPPGNVHLGTLDAQGGFDYPISEFGRRSAQTRIAREKLEAADLAFNRQLQQTTFNVKTAYYALAAAQEKTRAAGVNVQFAQTDLEAVARRMDAGLATLPDDKLAQERWARATLELDDAKASEAASEADLAVAVGVPASARLVAVGVSSLTIPSGMDRSVDAYVAQALKDRPDLAAEAATVRQRAAERALADADWRPELSLDGYYAETRWWLNLHKTGSPPDSLYYNATEPFYSLGLTLKWDLFAGFSQLNGSRRAEAALDAEGETLKARELEAISQVWRAYYLFQAMRAKYQHARALMSAASESYSEHVENYRRGLETLVELLTAQRDLAEARYAVIDATADLLTASAAMDYAVGQSSTTTSGGPAQGE